jgi:hypothetical protein
MTQVYDYRYWAAVFGHSACSSDLCHTNDMVILYSEMPVRCTVMFMIRIHKMQLYSVTISHHRRSVITVNWIYTDQLSRLFVEQQCYAHDTDKALRTSGVLCP